MQKDQINFRLDPELKDKFYQWCKKNYTTITAELVRMIAKKVKK